MQRVSNEWEEDQHVNMQTSVISQAARLMTKRSRSGQSIVIIALGFITLIAFVGIATDTALLFVRYSTLHRAIDAAAVAAAGAVRQNATYANVAAAAQEYLQVHGLDPQSVKVDTCETEIYEYINGAPGKTAHGGTGVAALAALIIGPPPSELCKPTPEKLVRVSAQILSPTTFLSIIGFKNVTLSASSLSQTAVMDVAIMLDVSQSESYDTSALEGKTVAPYTTIPESLNIFPAMTALGLGAYDKNNPSGAPNAANPQGTIRADCRNAPIELDISAYYSFAHNNPTYGDGTSSYSNYGWGGCCNEPAALNPPTNPESPFYYISVDGVIDTTKIIGGQVSTNPVLGKHNYSDLICQPFKNVRDAARHFLNRMDFVRGDRAYLITYGAAATALNPNGAYDAKAANSALPVFNDRSQAILALNKYAGVEDSPNHGQGDCVANSHAPYEGIFMSLYDTTAPCPDTNTGGAVQTMQSLITNPSWIRRDAVWIAVLMSDGYPNRTPGIDSVSGNGVSGPEHANIHKIPASNAAYSPAKNTRNQSNETYYDNFFVPSYPENYPTVNPPSPFIVPNPVSIVPGDTRVTDPGFCPWNTFCDPTFNNESYPGGLAAPSAPTGRDDISNYIAHRTAASNNLLYYPDIYHYNKAFCNSADGQSTPVWWSTALSTVGTTWVGAVNTGKLNVPFCTSSNPDARHWCMNNATGVINPIDISNACSSQYDAADFARDRVDFAALIDYTSTVKGNFIAMFSVFFNHVTSNDPNINNYILGAKFMRYVADAGDNGVIDNHVQQWYRTNLSPTNTDATNPAVPDANAAYPYDGSSSLYPSTPEDPCAVYDFREMHVFPGSAAYEDAYKHSCGNYYYADSPNAIDRAFADIASRLFTRLSR